MKRTLLIFALTFYTLSMLSQDAVEITGVVITKDEYKNFIPNVTILVKGRPHGTISNDQGFFSLAAVPGDTLIFYLMGFKKEKLYVPDTIKGDSYLAVVPMEINPELLQEVTIYPWPTPDRLHSHLLNMRVPTTELDIANRNLAIAALKERAAAMGYDAAEMQDYIAKMNAQAQANDSRYYGANGGAALLGALTNPFAWAAFFESLKK